MSMLIKNKLVFFLSIFAVILTQSIFCNGNKEDLSGEYFSIAQSYSELKKYDKAIDYYKKAEKSEEYKNAVQYNLAQVYALQNDWENCLIYLEPLYNQVPDNIKIAGAYSYALASAGKGKAASEIYKKIYLQSPETPEYFFNYIRILIVTKEYDEALKLLEAAKEQFTQEEDTAVLNELKEKIDKILNPPKEEDKDIKKEDDADAENIKEKNAASQSTTSEQSKGVSNSPHE